MAVLTPEAAKLYMRIDDSYNLEDSVLVDMIKTSISWCEEYTGLSFSVKDLTRATGRKRTELVAPVISITSVLSVNGQVVEYLYSDNVVYTCGETALISYKTGYTPENLPEPIRSAIKMMTATLSENRESFIVGERGLTMVDVPFNVTTLLRPYSRVGGLFL
ncbi:head-tail connector protein [Pedobacter cryoconitis]|uniref:Gp6-like head-tail connector protein n=1 Tax=Pedobacter cryoconitis TaxID=188932 RepID=A0A327SK68_9SPHI|nr:head-tail connector protein [Pedobacter cryoconitis]RAJ28872.1 gp6-like head-tail connector protein [Pedobacter cryoconitis]